MVTSSNDSYRRTRAEQMTRQGNGVIVISRNVSGSDYFQRKRHPVIIWERCRSEQILEHCIRGGDKFIFFVGGGSKRCQSAFRVLKEFKHFLVKWRGSTLSRRTRRKFLSGFRNLNTIVHGTSRSIMVYRKTRSGPLPSHTINCCIYFNMNQSEAGLPSTLFGHVKSWTPWHILKLYWPHFLRWSNTRCSFNPNQYENWNVPGSFGTWSLLTTRCFEQIFEHERFRSIDDLHRGWLPVHPSSQ